ncbi:MULTISPECIES: type VI secretion system transmembrane protein TssO [unclassified Dysgonomonas]|uniref:type VI secretion system transmembrane protein TssO n=1 Tax=unclassified Dysgonomonas TaxID=2630389 RepID=UPI0013EAF017|nr:MULTISPECIES: type VI secretion system transmembrane protein TssO [unclassified Dysgonomonas]
MEHKNKNTKNQREKTFGFIYVSLIFLTTTFACCFCLFYYSDAKASTRKEFVIAKMDRVRQFQHIQSDQMVIVDSIYNKIKDFNPGINASYEENDIKYYLNDFKSLYDDNSHDARYKIFYQVSGFYNLWFADKKELWSKQQNIASFRKNLEECEIGLQKKMDELKNTKK